MHVRLITCRLLRQHRDWRREYGLVLQITSRKGLSKAGNLALLMWTLKPWLSSTSYHRQLSINGPAERCNNFAVIPEKMAFDLFDRSCTSRDVSKLEHPSCLGEDAKAIHGVDFGDCNDHHL